MSHRIARLALAGLLVPVLALLLAMPTAFAQLPRPHKTDGTARKIYNTLDGNRYLATATFNRVITVDSGGNGDYSTIHDALAYVTSQPRGLFQRYLILVYPGDGSNNTNSGYNFTESTLTVPNYVILQGVAQVRANPGGYNGTPVIDLSGTTGALVTLSDNAAIRSLTFRMRGNTLTGNAQFLAAVSVVPGASILDAVQFEATNVTDGSFALDLAAVVGNAATAQTTLLAYDVALVRNGTGAGANSRNLALTSGATAIFYGGVITPKSGQAVSVETAVSGGLAGALKFYGTVLNTGATTTLKNSGSSSLQVTGTPYDTSGGTITDESVRAASVTYTGGMKDLYGTGSPEGVVTAASGSTYRRTDGGASTSFYVKESGTGNTGWVAK